MIKTSLISAICLFISVCSFGQSPSEKLNALYDTALIQQYSSSKYKLNNKTLKRKELKALLMSYPSSAEAYKVYNKNRKINSALWIAAGVAYVGSIFVVPTSEAAGIGLLGGSVLLLVSTIPSGIKADRSIHRAIWLYNKSVLNGEQKVALR